MTVSLATETALREAMARLLAGRPEHTDGRLTKENLYKEARVSRATMNRARDLLTAWDSAVAELASPHGQPPQCDPELTELRNKLKAKTQQCIELQQRLDAAATTIAALHHDNNALRQELAQRLNTTVTVLKPRIRQTTDRKTP